jgi:hypothetical protein
LELQISFGFFDFVLLYEVDEWFVFFVLCCLFSDHAFEEGQILSAVFFGVEIFAVFPLIPLGLDVLVLIASGNAVPVGDGEGAVHVAYSPHELLVADGVALDLLVLFFLVHLLVVLADLLVVGLYPVLLGLFDLSAVDGVFLFDYLFEDQVSVLAFVESFGEVLSPHAVLFLDHFEFSPLPYLVVLLEVQVLALMFENLIGVDGFMFCADGHEFLMSFFEFGYEHFHAKLFFLL